MMEGLSKKIQLLTDNYHEVKKEFRWDMSILNHFLALSYAAKGKRIDAEKIREIKSYIKDKTGPFSVFRGNNLSIMSLFLSFEDDYKIFFTEIQELVEKLKYEKISSYQFSPMIAYTFVKNSSYDNREEKIARAKLFYKNMKQRHMFLTSKDDYVYAALLGCTDLDVEETCRRIEYIYEKLNSMGYSIGNGLQTVSHVLALSDDFDFRIKLFDQIAGELKKHNINIRSYSWPFMAVMALVSDEASEICSQAAEVYFILKNTSGYGSFMMQGYIRTIISCALAASLYIPEDNKLVSISTGLSMQLIAVAQQQAMIAAASAAAASSGASGS
ncbi:MAG: DUF4003 family protein [Clostridiaceae bacterium]